MSTEILLNARKFIERETAKRKRQKPRLTLENGHGAIYHTDKPTLYGHSPYDRGSVLYGQDMRCWLGCWDSWDEARAELKEFGLKFDDLGENAGSTHLPIAQVVAHLPDDDGEWCADDWRDE